MIAPLTPAQVTAVVAELKAQGYVQLSPSQVVTASRCFRKWAIEKITGYRDPEDMATTFGSRVHEILEAYLTHGTPPSYDETWTFRPDWRAEGREPTAEEADAWQRAHDRRGRLQVLYPGRTALTMMGRHLPAPGSGTTEGAFVWHDPRIPGAFWLGYKDWRGHSPEGLRRIIDHKTTADPARWGKTLEQLQDDAQWLVYAEHESATVPAPSAGDAIAGTWNYGARNASPSKAKALNIVEPADTVRAKYESQIVPLARLMAQHKRAGTDPMSLPGNPHACGDFRGCPHRGTRCQLSDGERIGALMSDPSSQFSVASLLANVIGGAAPAAPATPAPAPAPATPAPAPVQAGADPVAAAIAKLTGGAAATPAPVTEAPAAAPAPVQPPPVVADNVNPPEAHAGYTIPSAPADPAPVAAPAPDAAVKFTQQDLEQLGRIIGEHVVMRLSEVLGRAARGE